MNIILLSSILLAAIGVLAALINKKMVYAEHLQDTTYYYVYDCFLSRWLEKL